MNAPAVIVPFENQKGVKLMLTPEQENFVDSLAKAIVEITKNDINHASDPEKNNVYVSPLQQG